MVPRLLLSKRISSKSSVNVDASLQAKLKTEKEWVSENLAKKANLPLMLFNTLFKTYG